MSRKSKGINAERELIHMIWAKNIPCVRVAGSGAIKYPSPDIIAGNQNLKAVIECKVSRCSTQYFTKDEISELVKFATEFGAQPFVAVKFNNKGWLFASPSELEETDKFFVIKSVDSAMPPEDFLRKFIFSFESSK